MFNYKEELKKIFLNNFPDVKFENFSFDKERTEFDNWDSLTHMQLIADIESAFDINFQMDEIVEINKPQDLLDLVTKKKENEPG